MQKVSRLHIGRYNEIFKRPKSVTRASINDRIAEITNEINRADYNVLPFSILEMRSIFYKSIAVEEMEDNVFAAIINVNGQGYLHYFELTDKRNNNASHDRADLLSELFNQLKYKTGNTQLRSNSYVLKYRTWQCMGLPQNTIIHCFVQLNSCDFKDSYITTRV